MLACMQCRELPTTPGVLWTPGGKKFRKSIMANQLSLKAIQWLYYLQETAEYLIDDDGNRCIIEHGFHHGEKRIGVDDVDGYAVVGSKRYIFEFLGCR